MTDDLAGEAPVERPVGRLEPEREARHGDWRAVEHGFNDSETPNVGIERLQ